MKSMRYRVEKGGFPSWTWDIDGWPLQQVLG
jgi:hypothetical protein